MARINWHRIGLHLLFWLVYILLNGVLSTIQDRLPIQENLVNAMVAEGFSLPPKIALVYFIFYYIIPLYLDRNKIAKLVLLTLLAVFFATLFYRLIVGLIYLPIFHPERNFIIFNLNGLVLTQFDLFITTAAAVTFKMIRVHYQSKEYEQELMREKMQSELSFLRAQTNPHFLFNTLNNLFVLARKKSDHTADAIMMLSKIMRFMLYECRKPRITLSEEVKVIHDYIELEKLRYTNRLSVVYQEDIDNPHTFIAPLLLLPLVENSFKHGTNSTTGAVIIQITISLCNHQLTFIVKNTVDRDAGPILLGNGIGLQNIKRQLDLLYAGHYHLKTNRENGFFEAKLDLNLHV
jgi:sensor histidine kinase YesM